MTLTSLTDWSLKQVTAITQQSTNSNNKKEEQINIYEKHPGC